jgi:hypothetical protein
MFHVKSSLYSPSVLQTWLNLAIALLGSASDNQTCSIFHLSSWTHVEAAKSQSQYGAQPTII